jgi:hypothetical protein
MTNFQEFSAAENARRVERLQRFAASVADTCNGRFEASATVTLRTARATAVFPMCDLLSR